MTPCLRGRTTRWSIMAALVVTSLYVASPGCGGAAGFERT